MKAFDDNYSELDLKCDFPARESFRESLFTRLLSVDEQAAHKDGDEIQELSDSDLELLAAAQGEPYIPNEWLDDGPTGRRH